jgi:WRKY DNA -binding domain
MFAGFDGFSILDNVYIYIRTYRDERERQQPEEPSAAAVNNAQLVMPEDGFEWRKYGQKYIRNIKKVRYSFLYIL